MDEPLTVKQFSDATGVDTERIRYWSKIGLLNPVSRGEKNQYKYYSERQVLRASAISCLLELDTSYDDIFSILSEHSPQNTSHQLKLQRSVLRKKIRELDTLYSVLELRNDCLDLGMMINNQDLRIFASDQMPLTIGEPILWNDYCDPYSAFIKFAVWVKNQGVDPICPAGGYYESFERFLENPQLPDRFFVLNPFGKDCREGTHHLIGYAHGDFGELDIIRDRMRDFSKIHVDTTLGAVYVIYLLDGLCTDNPSEYLAQVCVVVQPGESNLFENGFLKNQ